MAQIIVLSRVLDDAQLECRITDSAGPELTLTGSPGDLVPEASGSSLLRRNQALVNNAWAYALLTFKKVNLPTEPEQDAAARLAKHHRKVTEWIAGFASDLGDDAKQAWCSACFSLTQHCRTMKSLDVLPVFVCQGCGSPTVTCVAPRCGNMTAHEKTPGRNICAEHRHEITGFGKATMKVETLNQYEEFISFDKLNLLGAGKKVAATAVGVAAMVPLAMMAAPAIGGAIGVYLGYSGAAATSSGLALLGGGSIASGGLGMAGGTMVISAAGGALGGALGASVTNAYVREDKSFHIELLKGGEGVPVVVCNGFLTEAGKGWGDWRELVTARYPDSPVYRVHWGAKELKNLGGMFVSGSAKQAAASGAKAVAASATKVGSKMLAPVGAALLVADLGKNPWHVAVNRAEKTGVVLADLIARTLQSEYVLIGHSLGARVLSITATELGTKPDGPRIKALHLLGAAINASGDRAGMTVAVEDGVYNYFSSRDNVLKLLYATAQGGKTAAGYRGFKQPNVKIQNVDVSDEVANHQQYIANVQLR